MYSYTEFESKQCNYTNINDKTVLNKIILLMTEYVIHTLYNKNTKDGDYVEKIKI